ncbi:hypothetical protein C4J83_2209 [Pseudomonas sp. LBUM920]|nr:hypothetical protein C4J83_2209 [Pseudomonas sp. LBUM920]
MDLSVTYLIFFRVSIFPNLGSSAERVCISIE